MPVSRLRTFCAWSLIAYSSLICGAAAAQDTEPVESSEDPRPNAETPDPEEGTSETEAPVAEAGTPDAPGADEIELAATESEPSESELTEAGAVSEGLADNEASMSLTEGATAAGAEQAAEPETSGPTFEFGAEIRARGDARLNPYSGGGVSDDVFSFGSRIRLSVGATYGVARVFLQVQDARSFGGLSGGGTDFHQGFAEFGNDEAWLRVGRQELKYGRQRLVGSLNWAHSARSFDAISGHISFGDVGFDAFGAMVRAPETMMVQQDVEGEMVDVPIQTEGDYLAGAYITANLVEEFALDGFAIFRHDGPTPTDVTRDRNIITAGMRLHGLAGPVSLDIEGMVQQGSANGESHLGFASTADVTVAFAQDSLPTSVGIGGAYASGGSTDGSIDEFDNFYPTNHIFYGIVDLFGLRNLIEGHASATLAPRDSNFSGTVAFHQFWLATAEGRWSNAPGRTVGQSDTLSTTAVGSEVDVILTWKPFEGTLFQVGGGVFFPLGAATELGLDEPQTYLYVMTGYTL